MTLRRGSLACSGEHFFFPRCLVLDLSSDVEQLALGADRRCGRAAATTGRGAAAAAGRVSGATAGAAATVAIVASVVVAVMIAILVVIFVLVAVVAPAEPGPRMAFVFAGKG
jgi:hypothetical protein